MNNQFDIIWNWLKFWFGLIGLDISTPDNRKTRKDKIIHAVVIIFLINSFLAILLNLAFYLKYIEDPIRSRIVGKYSAIAKKNDMSNIFFKCRHKCWNSSSWILSSRTCQMAPFTCSGINRIAEENARSTEYLRERTVLAIL